MDMFLECLLNEIFPFVFAKPACFSAVTEECFSVGHFIVHFHPTQASENGSQEEEGSQAVVLVRTACMCTYAHPWPWLW